MVWLTEAETPRDMRIYAIGDVHGCLDELKDVHHRIAADLEKRPAGDFRIVHIGDYVDRGPDSRGVVDYLIGLCETMPNAVCLQGNHDHMFVESVSGNSPLRQTWLQNGGAETLESYGLTVADYLDRLAVRRGFDDVIPSAHITFLAGLKRMVRLGDYLFVHAGINPDLPLDAQPDEALLWMRQPFLGDGREFDAVVIHGHTPVNRPEVKANRVGIDTGAVFGGELTCLLLQGMGKARLGASGPQALI